MSSVKELWGLFIIGFAAVSCNAKVLAKQRVCVIGAGRAGLAAVKLLADQMHHFELFAVERNSDVGGLWIYRDDPYVDEHNLNAHSGIYKHLKTNFPIKYMAYPDYPVFEGLEDERAEQLVPHQLFLEYMRNYTEHFKLRKYIQFDRLVTKVSAVRGSDDYRPSWHMRMRHLNSSREEGIDCDALVVANGHFSKEYVPRIAGLESFPGRVLHSRAYRKPQDFANERVVVLGAGDSGTDIALALANYSNKVYLSHRHNSIVYPGELPSNVHLVGGVESVNGTRFTLQDNSTISADAFIFCTGYQYDFPFLDESSGISFDRKHVRPLYQQFINALHPNMAFVGLAVAIDYSKQYYEQTKYFIDVLRGKQLLPSHQQMLDIIKNEQ